MPCGMCSVPRFGRKQRPGLLFSVPLPSCLTYMFQNGSPSQELHANCSHLSSRPVTLVFETSKPWFPSLRTPGKSSLDFARQSQEERRDCGLLASDDFGVGGRNKRIRRFADYKVPSSSHHHHHSASPVIYGKGSTYMH